MFHMYYNVSLYIYLQVMSDDNTTAITVYQYQPI